MSGPRVVQKASTAWEKRSHSTSPTGRLIATKPHPDQHTQNATVLAPLRAENHGLGIENAINFSSRRNESKIKHKVLLF